LHPCADVNRTALLVALVIGALSGQTAMNSVEGFFVTPFQGVLALVLLEMGMLAGRRLGDLKKLGVFLLAHGRPRHHVSLQHHCRSAAFL